MPIYILTVSGDLEVGVYVVFYITLAIVTRFECCKLPQVGKREWILLLLTTCTCYFCVFFVRLCFIFTLVAWISCDS